MPIVYSLTLEVIRIFQILTLCLILASGASQKKFDYKKVKTTFGSPLIPIKHQHWTPPLTNLKGGGFQTMPLLPMLKKEARAQFYRDKNMWRNAAREKVLWTISTTLE